MALTREFDPTKELNHHMLQGLWATAFPSHRGRDPSKGVACSYQTGRPGHGYVAQLWGLQGESIAMVDMTDDPAVATARAQLAAYAMTNVLKMQDELEHLRSENKRLRVQALHVQEMAQAVSEAQAAMSKVRPGMLRKILGLGK